jgi:hypothetical protein
MEPLEENISEDPVKVWLEESINPAVSESSLYLYEFSRLDLRDIDNTREMLTKLIMLNHKLGILYADAVELKNEFQTQCDEIYSQVVLMFGGKNPNTDAKLTQESVKAAGELASSNFQAFRELFPSVALRLSLTVGDEPRRRHNAVSATAEKLKGIQRDIQESINAIKHIGNRDLQHVIHGL